jgi:hypothetical protein
VGNPSDNGVARRSVTFCHRRIAIKRYVRGCGVGRSGRFPASDANSPVSPGEPGLPFKKIRLDTCLAGRQDPGRAR